jgi:hypothetical protein
MPNGHRPGVAASELAAAEERLREIHSIMDTALQHLDVDDLLTVLLERVLLIVSSDTAAVLLLDEDSGQLVVRAARGVDGKVPRSLQVGTGSIFAGRIAAEQRPVILDRVDPTTGTNPIPWEKSIETMLGVPLVAGGQLLGELHVGRFTRRPFGPQEMELLELVASRMSGAVQASVLKAERTAAKTLLRTLLPSALPSTPDLRFASRYLPAEVSGVGGDWYDAFTLPSGDIWVVTGDVEGHGLRAAVVMSHLRSTLRAYAFEGWAPEAVLHLADQKLQHFENGMTATVACAVFAAPFDHFHLALAGHPPPVLAIPGRSTELLEVVPAPLLGATSRPGPAATRFEMPPGAVLVLYTDGLVERRDEPLDQSLERLRSAVTAEHPELVCRRVTDALVGDWPQQDDVALVALQRHPCGLDPPGARGGVPARLAGSQFVPAWAGGTNGVGPSDGGPGQGHPGPPSVQGVLELRDRPRRGASPG